MELIHKYFKDLTPEMTTKLGKLQELYTDWNSKINVISRKDMDQFYCNHVLHSLSIAKIQSFSKGEEVMDIGTGGGFPGIPLAILFPDTSFTLVDSITKKTKVVFEVAEALGLDNVTVVNDRFEQIDDKYDYIVSRAVAPAARLVSFTKNASKVNTQHLFLKGGDLKEEKHELKNRYPKTKWEENTITRLFDEGFFTTKKIIRLSL